ncbi:MAG: UDP-N-acetylglucosamine--N-acetylmuramyl-(pentapeptide) pyrophosphoryl-undecaprenol N-acetylglucosamine transferase, partial [Actinomycetota bacterium]
MTNFLLTGGGTAGHVNPLLAVAKSLVAQGHKVYALGTADGLEARLVPEAGIQLLTVEKVPFPRRPGFKAVAFPFRFQKATKAIEGYLAKYEIGAVVGFGGYVSAPAYRAAKRKKLPLIIHEANALAGMANRYGNKFASAAGVAFRSSNLEKTDFVGLPLRDEIVQLAKKKDVAAARNHFGLRKDSLTLLVTGGSLGARSINRVIDSTAPLLRAAGIQILHIVGDKSPLEELSDPEYRRIKYCYKMELAFAACDFAVSRAGAATVSELSALGIPALYIPYPVGNGEQNF